MTGAIQFPASQGGRAHDAGGVSLYVFYMNLISVWPEQIRRASFVGLVVYSFHALSLRKKGAKENFVPWYDLLLGLVGAAAYFYYVANIADLAVKATRISQFDVFVGVVGVLVTAEVCRRVVGLPILVVASAFVGYAFYAGYSLKRIIYTLFYTLDGVIGTHRGLFTFIVYYPGFVSGKDEYRRVFYGYRESTEGRLLAVIASAKEGMSGSSVANTVGSAVSQFR